MKDYIGIKQIKAEPQEKDGAGNNRLWLACKSV